MTRVLPSVGRVAVPSAPRAHRVAPGARGVRRGVRAVVLALGLLVGLAAAQERQLDPEVFAIGSELRCPTCVSESVADSSSAIAREMRQIIQDRLDAGDDRAEILAFFQERYGDWILLNPPARGVTLVVWVLPVVAVLGGAVLLVVLMRRWRAAAAEVPDVDPADRERVRAALAGADAAATPPRPTDRPEPRA